MKCILNQYQVAVDELRTDAELTKILNGNDEAQIFQQTIGAKSPLEELYGIAVKNNNNFAVVVEGGLKKNFF